MGEFDGTKVGPDGKRYASGSVPSLTEKDIVGESLRVFGDPSANYVPKWNGGATRAEWAAASSGGGGGLAPATAVTTTTLPNPISGSGDITVTVLPADSPVLAVMIEGDTYPRLLINADPGDFAAIMLGDGTVDPSTAGASIGLFGDNGDPSDMDLVLSVQTGRSIRFDGQVIADGPVVAIEDVTYGTGVGPVVKSSNGTHYRVVVADDGTLSTTEV